MCYVGVRGRGDTYQRTDVAATTMTKDSRQVALALLSMMQIACGDEFPPADYNEPCGDSPGCQIVVTVVGGLILAGISAMCKGKVVLSNDGRFGAWLHAPEHAVLQTADTDSEAGEVGSQRDSQQRCSRPEEETSALV